jgi:hypothetical protein
MPPQHGASSGCGWRNDFQLWKLAANILNKQQWTNHKGWSSSLGLGERLTIIRRKKKYYEKSNRASDLDGLFGYTTQATKYGYEIWYMEY